MKAPNHVSKAYDVLYVIGGGTLDRPRIQAILDNYNGADYPTDYDTEIKAIQYDGTAHFGAWVYCDRGDGHFAWLYLAAGDPTNRQLTAQAAGGAGGGIKS